MNRQFNLGDAVQHKGSTKPKKVTGVHTNTDTGEHYVRVGYGNKWHKESEMEPSVYFSGNPYYGTGKGKS